MNKQIIQSAINELENEKSRIDQTIQALRNQLNGTVSGKRGRRSFTPAQKKAQAKRMRAFWKKKKKTK